MRPPTKWPESIGGVCGVLAFIVGFSVAAFAPACGAIDDCDCPAIGDLFETTATACDVSSYNEQGGEADLPFGAFAPTVRTSPSQVVIEYVVDEAEFAVVYAVRD